MALGNRLKQLLNEKGITVKEFAQRIEVAPTTLYSFIKRDSESGKLELLHKISMGLDMSISEFLDFDGAVNDLGQTKIDNNLYGIESSKSMQEKISKKLVSNKEKNMTDLFSGSSSLAENFSKEQQLKQLSNNINKNMQQQMTIAAHFDSDEFTEEELEQIKKFAEFVKSQRKERK